jgi:hypothetical protein
VEEKQSRHELREEVINKALPGHTLMELHKEIPQRRCKRNFISLLHTPYILQSGIG